MYMNVLLVKMIMWIKVIYIIDKLEVMVVKLGMILVSLLFDISLLIIYLRLN